MLLDSKQFNEVHIKCLYTYIRECMSGLGKLLESIINNLEMNL